MWALRETWRLNTEADEHHHDDGYVSIHHGPTQRTCRRGSLGIMLVLRPAAVGAYERGGHKRKTYGSRVLAFGLDITGHKKRDPPR